MYAAYYKMTMESCVFTEDQLKSVLLEEEKNVVALAMRNVSGLDDRKGASIGDILDFKEKEPS